MSPRLLRVTGVCPTLISNSRGGVTKVGAVGYDRLACIRNGNMDYEGEDLMASRASRHHLALGHVTIGRGRSKLNACSGLDRQSGTVNHPERNTKIAVVQTRRLPT